MKLVVFGASGGTGRAAAGQAAARGDEVTAFVRRGDRLHLRQPRVRVVEGDAFDAAVVSGAVRGQDAVLSLLGARPWRHTEVCSQGMRHIVSAMVEHGVRRLVAVSWAGVGNSRQELGWFAKHVAVPVMRRAFEDVERMEDIVRASDLDWVIVRPALLTSGSPRGTWRTALDGSIPGSFIPRADVAAFCLVQLTSDQYIRQTPTIA